MFNDVYKPYSIPTRKKIDVEDTSQELHLHKVTQTSASNGETFVGYGPVLACFAVELVLLMWISQTILDMMLSKNAVISTKVLSERVENNLKS